MICAKREKGTKMKRSFVRLDMPQHRFSTKFYLFLLTAFIVAFLGVGAWCTQVFDVHNQENVVKKNAEQLAQVVCALPCSAICQSSDSMALTLNVRCADNKNQTTQFVCTVDPTWGQQQVAQTLSYNWTKLLREHGKTFTSYSGSQVFLFEGQQARIIADKEGDYSFTLWADA